MHPWLTEASATLADAIDADAETLQVDEATATALLDLARVAAHDSGDRTNAPLLAFLVGVAYGRSGRPLQTLIDAATASAGEGPAGA
ncbi:MAG TPA: DUF6457 domain-containing protein [Solirubrobacteraceae bacterium]|nr:DUF6457 domain-containing protein [Solirubrobacteraceae bacterium]